MNNEIRKILELFCKLQSAMHSIDEISSQANFKHKLKQETNRYLKTIESIIEPITKDMDAEESQYYVDIVSQIDKLASGNNDLKETR